MSFINLINKYKEEALSFTSEEDVRIKTNSLLEEFSNLFNFELKTSGHEVTSAYGGRADSIYSDVIFEYKAPCKFDSQKGIKEALYGRNDKDRGLIDYLINFSLEDNISADDDSFLNTLFQKVGIGFDGNKLVLARYTPSETKMSIYNKNKTLDFPEHISKEQYVKFEFSIYDNLELGFKKLILTLRSTTRKRLSSTNLIESFGPKSDVASKTILYLYNILEANINDNTRVSTLFEEWSRIFGDIYGDIETDFTQFRDSLKLMYKLDSNIDVKKMLFIIQTYYNVVLKLLVYNLIESLSDPLSKTKNPEDRSSLNTLFSGKLYSGNYKIENFFEIHFFEWFIYSKEFDNSYVHDIITQLETFETTASIIKPEVVEDVLREVYSSLMPSELRHLMGEYYTPGWLVEFALDNANYNGEYNKTLLDPTCGSGSFITHAIKRLKSNNATLESQDFINISTNNIVGYDINPIAVISAKTNYILALGDLTDIDSPINIPIYMCDSVLVPTVHAKQNEETHSIKVNTIVGTFEIPVFHDRVESDLFLRQISHCILSEEYSFDEFIRLMQKENLISFQDINMDLVRKFYDQLTTLHLSGRNGYWGIILKNAFAPLFAKGGYDVVVGNPPWISWKAMSDTYRKQTLDIWLSYGIFDKSAYDKITTHDDFAMAVTYVAIDHYCKQNGEVVFVLPQTFLKASKGGEGFRKFRITRDENDIPFSISKVYDMEEIKPFREFAANKTSVIIFEKNKEMSYPMNQYYLCHSKKGEVIKYRDSYEKALSKIEFEQLSATPINSEDIRSPWLTMPEAVLKQQDKFLGSSQYKGRKGIEPCGAKGIYLLNINKKVGVNVEIENLIDRSRLKKAKELGVNLGVIEKDLIYPMVGGRNIDRWGINSYIYILVPHYSNGESIYAGMPESELKVNYNKTFNWLLYFKELLLETRIRNGKFFNEKTQPFYRLDNVGPYTFSQYHVVWREQHKQMTSCVISTIDDPYLGEKIAVTDSKVLFCALENEQEAHYLCAIINSSTISYIIESYTINTQRGVDILKNIKIPSFDSKDNNHIELSKLSLEAHEKYRENLLKEIKDIEKRIDELVNLIF